MRTRKITYWVQICATDRMMEDGVSQPGGYYWYGTKKGGWFKDGEPRPVSDHGTTSLCHTKKSAMRSARNLDRAFERNREKGVISVMRFENYSDFFNSWIFIKE